MIFDDPVVPPAPSAAPAEPSRPTVVARQGDVLFLSPAPSPAGCPRIDQVIAAGSSTGNQHVVVGGNLYLAKDGDRILVAGEKCRVTHVGPGGSQADHDDLAIPEGRYIVRIKRVYEPDGWRNVED